METVAAMAVTRFQCHTEPPLAQRLKVAELAQLYCDA